MSEAAGVLCESFPAHNKWERGAQPDFSRLLDCAQGRGISFETAMDKQRLARREASARDDAEEDLTLAQLTTTNFSIALMQQQRTF